MKRLYDFSAFVARHAVLPCVLLSTAAAAPAQRMVFAHYMLTNQDYQGDSDPTQELKIAAYQREIREAQAAGKLAHDYQIPAMHGNNTPRALEERFVLARARGLYSDFPFGTDFTSEEIVLAKALARLEDETAHTWPRVQAVAGAVLARGTPANLKPYLDRMGLGKPQTRQEWLWQRLLVRALRATI